LTRQYFTSNPQQPFSDGVLIDGRALYLSGRIGLKPGTREVPEDVRGVLSRAGMGFDDLVFVQVFSPDVSLWDRFNAVYVRHFTGPTPPRAFIGSGPLLFSARFELQGIAVKDAPAQS
jgi:enamine deaminase RidA (YjgF/YER057c/UK114 family)